MSLPEVSDKTRNLLELDGFTNKLYNHYNLANVSIPRTTECIIFAIKLTSSLQSPSAWASSGST